MGRGPKKFPRRNNGPPPPINNGLYPPTNAGVFLFERTGEGIRVCVVQEKNGKWNIPSGKIDRGEYATSAATRELFEESSELLDYDPDETYITIQIRSFHLVFIKTSKTCISSTLEFENLRMRKKLCQKETINMKWELVAEIYIMKECNKLRGCFASLLDDPHVIAKLSLLNML